MSAVPFDTLKLADKLQAGGFTPEQARSAASALVEAMSSAELATKADIKEAEIRLEAKIDAAKTELLKWLAPMLFGQAALIAALVKLL